MHTPNYVRRTFHRPMPCEKRVPFTVLASSSSSTPPSQPPSTTTHPKTSSCYGCGVLLQTSDPNAIGFVDPEKFAVKQRHRQLNQLICTRCQALSNGAMIPGVADFQQVLPTQGHQQRQRQTGYGNDDKTKALATPEELRDQLRHVRASRALVVLLIDLLDASGSMLGRVRDLVGGNPIIAVGTKADLLPSGTAPADVELWLQDSLAYKRISTDSVHVVSSRTGDGVPEAVASIRRTRLGRDVYIMGAANVGKSSFVRSLVKDMSTHRSRQFDPLAPHQVKHLPTESAMPGTTLRVIPLDVFSSGGTLYDTPGLHLHHRIPHMLTPEENKQLHPRKRVKRYAVGPLHTGQSLAWGGLVRLDVVESTSDGDPEDGGMYMTFCGPPCLRVVSSGTDSTATRTDPLFGEESVALRGGLRMARSVDLHSNSGGDGVHQDIAISGIPGWIAVHSSGRRKGGVKMNVWAPVGVEVYMRPAFPIPCQS